MKLTYMSVRLYTDARTWEAIVIIRKLPDSGGVDDGMRTTSVTSVLTLLRHHIQTYLR
jgi:hypothetical protein